MSAITDILHRQLSFSEALNKAIQQEHQALVEYNTTKLEKLAKEKLHYLQQIEALELRRIEACPVISADNRSDTLFIQWLESQPNPTLLLGIWQQVKENLAACRQSNANGKVILMTHRSVEKGLRLLKGQTQDSTTYSRNGYTTNHVASRTYATA